MKMEKTLTNMEIYNIAMVLAEMSQENLSLPIKVNFYLQKNIKTMVALGQDIESSRIEILDKYGTKNEETGDYNFEQDVIDTVNQEIYNLFALTQEVPTYVIDIADFGDIEISSKYLNAIDYMINEEE